MIFVSYRRQDTQSATGRLCDKLQLHFGDDRVFHDIESIQPGADFGETIAARVAESSVVLVMIGPRWLDAGSGARPRIHDPDDYVRLEITTALRRRIPIIPVLVEGASIPDRSRLPPEVAPLFDRQAHEISEPRWQYDTDRLVEQLEKVVPPRHQRGAHAGPSARGAAGDSVVSAALASLSGYVGDFVQLLAHPRGHFAVLLSRPDHLLRATGFFVVSHLVAAWLFALPGVVTSLPAFVLAGVPLGAFVLLLVALPLHLAGRLLRVPNHAPMTLAMCAYMQSVAFIISAAGVHLTWVGIEISNPSFAPVARDILFSTAPLEERARGVMEILEPAITSAFMGTLALAILLWLFAAGWLLVAAGAFRDIWHLSRLRAAAVAVLFATILLVVAGFVTLAAASAAGGL